MGLDQQTPVQANVAGPTAHDVGLWVRARKFGNVLNHYTFHTATCAWKSFLTPWVVWNISLIMVWFQDGWAFAWLDEVEGFQHWHLGLDVQSSSVVACILHLRMEHDVFSIQVGVTHNQYDVHAKCLHAVAAELFKLRQLVDTCEIIPDAWPERTSRLLTK